MAEVMMHHWTLRLVAGMAATVWALCTLPACGDCVDKTGSVSSCFPWTESATCPTDEKLILERVRKQEPTGDYVSVTDTATTLQDGDPPQCCYLVEMNYTDCGYRSVPGF